MATSKKNATKKKGQMSRTAGTRLGVEKLKPTKGSRAGAAYYKKNPEGMKKMIAGDSTEGKRMDRFMGMDKKTTTKKAKKSK